MKIAIASSSNTLDANTFSFGRCPYFLIYDTIKKEYHFLENLSSNQLKGAGVASVRFIASKNVDLVIAKKIGPHALKVLTALGIKILIKDENLRNIINQVKNGKQIR